ncbi:MAG TPA: tRNA uridine-5-carboxymethylaminomethyl(34) synthesis GTPase MnmE, partial [Allosphingosinicella sp.]|nr:tRNA uridine-5-carboxymethylaminomethyl(34) synthesis GTPase MnmE [Allosphingosinicella sp.]
SGNVLLVQSKCDLPAEPRVADVRVSALTGDGMGDLIREISARAVDLLPSDGEIAVNARQRGAIGDVLSHLREAAAPDMLLAAEALRLARVELDRVTGRAGVEDMLDSLFGRFCIGK